MQRIRLFHYITLALTIVWMAVIFIFSSQNGETSSNASGFIVDFIASIFIPDLHEYDIAKQQDILNTISFIVRKGAHFTEYAILGLLSFLTVVTYIWKKLDSGTVHKCTDSLRLGRVKYITYSLIFSCLYAISDEFHQGFVADRAPAVTDVCIDTCGALAGILFFYFILIIYLKKKEA